METIYTDRQRQGKVGEVCSKYYNRVTVEDKFKDGIWYRLCKDLAFILVMKEEARLTIMRDGIELPEMLMSYAKLTDLARKAITDINTFINTNGDAIL